jgi:hypothetical protein
VEEVGNLNIKLGGLLNIFCIIAEVCNLFINIVDPMVIIYYDND